jgi:hypothetical protein
MDLLRRFVQVTRQHGPLEAARRSVRRLRNRVIKPLLQRHEELRVEVENLRHAYEAEIKGLVAEARDLRTELESQRREIMSLQCTHESLANGLIQLRARLHDSDGRAFIDRNTLRNHSNSILWLAEHHSSVTARSVNSSKESETFPHVSIIMPVWNREATISRAIESVIAQSFNSWELLVIDDGSTDRTAQVVARYQSDKRIQYRYQAHTGAAAARNAALAESRGELIAYLDSDNSWYPGILAAVVDAFREDETSECAYFAQVWRQAATEATWIRSDPFDSVRMLEMQTGIDLNVFVHRRRLYKRLGGFDCQLTRLIDWDLILRYTNQNPPKRIPAIGCCYEDGSWGRISTEENLEHNRYLVRRKFLRPIRSSLRVLYAVWEFPHLSETYVATEIACMQRWGIQVEVWSETEPESRYAATVPIHRGSLESALHRVRPDVIHAHWLDFALRHASVAERAGIPMTVRGHSFEFDPQLPVKLQQASGISAVYVFPHFVTTLPSLDKVRAVTACFDPERYFPSRRKDRNLVLRAGAALPTKDLGLFVRAARRCPKHQFVLALVRTKGRPECVEEMIEYNRSMGSPVDLRVNVPVEQMSELMSRAAIYLHTHSPECVYGMPVSIAEAMATGAVVFGRRCAAAESYIGDAGQCYDDEDQAVQLVNATAEWSEEKWRQASNRAIDRAYGQFLDTSALQPVLEDWLRMSRATPNAACPAA